MRHASQIDAFAYVVDGEGFRAAAMRSAISLISLAARYPFPQKAFGRVEDAIPWMLSRPSRSSADDQHERRAPAAANLLKRAKSLRRDPASVAAAG